MNNSQKIHKLEAALKKNIKKRKTFQKKSKKKNKQMSVLSDKGELYFSGHKKSFKLSSSIISNFEISDISNKSIPQDFRNKRIHYLYNIKHKTPEFL